MSEPIVKIKQGQLKGVTDKNTNGETFYKFLGIPYAKPPVGRLRFKAPQPPEPWEGIRDCTIEGSPCKSINLFTNEIIGSEDCLVLNVFTKEVSTKDLKPVMVFIHGGAFTLGSSTQNLHGARLLLNEEVVLVTLNYRLGLLGFLSINEESIDVPGNAGLKDQTMALKWVQENIANFGGNPNNVTIFGVSAGGASVQYQVLSPAAKGLFHKAIIQSGSVLNPWAWGRVNAIEVANLLKENISTEKDAYDVLMDTPIDVLYEASLKITDNIVDSSVTRPFGPVVERPNPTAFLTENPIDILSSGNYNQVPIIQGMVSSEGQIYDIMKCITKKDIEVHSNQGVLWYLGVKKGTEEFEKIKQLINEFYFKNGTQAESIHKFFGDTLFHIGIIDSLKLTVKTSSEPVYSYILSAETDVTSFQQSLFGIPDLKKAKGVAHGGDQMYLFNGVPSMNFSEEGLKVSRMVIKLWTSFASTGVPIHENIHWEPITDPNELKYLDISTSPTLETNPFTKSLEFWDGIDKKKSYSKIAFNAKL